MIPSHGIRTFNDFRDAAYGFRLSRIILSALELDLFSKMGQRAWTLSALARRIKCSPRGVDILCRNLAGTGLLKKEGPTYQASHLAQQYLNRHSPDFRGAYLELLQRQWQEWSNLTEAIRTGRPSADDEPETPEYRQSFTWAMHDRSLDAARQVARQLSLNGARSLLDLGGGPGTYTLQFLSRHPKMVGTIMDRPAALEVAGILAERHRLQARLSLVAGDFLSQRISGTFDVVWYSNVLHIYSPKENLKIFRKVRRALAPGGRILIQDTFLQDSNKLVPLEANLFAVSMLLYTQTGNTYGLREVQDWLLHAGFSRTRVIRLQPGTGDWEGTIVEGRLHP